MSRANRLSVGPRIDLGNGESTEPIANFRGSFVIDHFDDVPASYSVANHKPRIQNWVAVFRDGWGDVGIWKSAVCNPR